MFFRKKNKQLRNLKQAKDAVASASKVFSYRRDLMSESDELAYRQLLDKAGELIISKNYDSEEFSEVEAKLEELMQKFGGNIYPLKTITDYIETIVVAAVLALSVRSFFLTPFKIPTNSMYPSFYGMTAKVYDRGEPEPNIAAKAWNWLSKSASNYTLVAPDSGEILLEISVVEQSDGTSALSLPAREVASKFLGVWPTYNKEYVFYVNGKGVTLSVPKDFSFEDVLKEAYPDWSNRNNFKEKNSRLFASLGNINKDERILNFDILGGDMLFVDKFSYNFRKPKIGEPVVFLTKYCDGMTANNGGVPVDNYYIKRLVGQGGDKLKIDNFTLYRNGEPIKGNPAFDKNTKQEDNYCGYRNEKQLAEGNEVVVPNAMYYMLGDNSANSLDSRYWGYVPEKAVIGRPLFIFYPFTR